MVFKCDPLRIVFKLSGHLGGRDAEKALLDLCCAFSADLCCSILYRIFSGDSCCRHCRLAQQKEYRSAGVGKYSSDPCRIYDRKFSGIMAEQHHHLHSLRDRIFCRIDPML